MEKAFEKIDENWTFCKDKNILIARHRMNINDPRTADAVRKSGISIEHYLDGILNFSSLTDAKKVLQYMTPLNESYKIRVPTFQEFNDLYNWADNYDDVLYDDLTNEMTQEIVLAGDESHKYGLVSGFYRGDFKLEEISESKSPWKGLGMTLTIREVNEKIR